MEDQFQTNNASPNKNQDDFQVQAPAINLPKGGGAIRGIGEKFAANPVTGTGSMSVPIATSPGRSGFGPKLSLSYDSGAGKGPFGLGWSLSLPSITRKTDKGLPRYLDAEASDEFILSGAEDLVPALVEEEDNPGTWIPEPVEPRTVGHKTYKIQRYRPRIEGLFARIERWTNILDPTDCFWRSISRDNITTWYGKSDQSRITDPADLTHIFSWLICESHDDKGNVIAYEYKPEDSTGVCLFQTHERNRTKVSRSANRYIKHIKYGNRHPYFPELTAVQPPTTLPTEWLFEVVFDYDEHESDAPAPDDDGAWRVRHDPFSAYRAGFEVRTYRLCQRVLMFHHFPDEAGVGVNCLVRSTDFTYRYEQSPADPRNPIHTVLTSVTQCGWRRQAGGSYLKKTLPPVEFDYSQVVLGTGVKTVEPGSVENLPYGVDGANYQWVDLDGEGSSGVLTEQGGAWFYKRNESPITRSVDNGTESYTARLGAVETVGSMPAGGLSGTSRRQFLDLAGDGQLDVVELDQPLAGFYEHSHQIAGSREQGWETFLAFAELPNIAWDDPNLRFVDLTGDGHADVLITENEVFTWYPSLAEVGFDESERVQIPTDEERGPNVVFADGTQTLFQADLSGDGLTDIARIRNGEVCYWPNLGYGRFGAKVSMDDAPWFDSPELFDPRRIRLTDIDGSGVTDIIYLGCNETRFWFNQSGNTWSAAQTLDGFPPVDHFASVAAIDLLGNGTACLVWSTPATGEAQSPMRYLELMAEGKPHLMIGTRNNLGAETRVRYAPSTFFYFKDKQDGKPWITRLPFPVHVVERVEAYDHISRNRFVARYAYHHGYFDGVEREFRGFGMVEQYDTEAFAALNSDGQFPIGDNIDESSHVPPVLTRTWFHTGVYLGRDRVSNFFAGLCGDDDQGEYYREPGLTDAQAQALLLNDTILPAGLTTEEEREACRALKGSMLRQEVYALDGTQKEDHPYTVTEQNFTIRTLQPIAGNCHGIFFTHPNEVITYHYERNPADPRISHTITLEVDDYGNALKNVSIGYGRRRSDINLPLKDRVRQAQTFVTYTENRVTNDIEAVDAYRTPLPCETHIYELTGYTATGAAERFQHFDFVQPDPGNPGGRERNHVFDDEINYESLPTSGRQRRLIEQVRTLYRPDDMGGFRNDPLALLPLATMESQALAGETYKLAFTPGLLKRVYQRTLDGQPPENLLPDPALVLPVDISGGNVADRGGYVDLDKNGHWWIPAGRVFYTFNDGDSASQELTHARRHFYLLSRYIDPFGQASTVEYDAYDLLMVETRDALDNRITSENDYRVLQATVVTDPNRNRTGVSFDTLGMVVGSAVMGKAGKNVGESLAEFEADLTEEAILEHLSNPLTDPHSILNRASARLVYDLFAYQRSQYEPIPHPAVVYSLVRESHDADLDPGQLTKIQHRFAYSDGFGRQIQNKIQAEPGAVPQENGARTHIAGTDNGHATRTEDEIPRWVGSGWTVFNNKGQPVRKYEPFFTDTHRYEFDIRIGVSPVLFYDPAERLIATSHPNHTWEKVVFDPWRQETWDVNDTVLVADPGGDKDVGDFFLRLSYADYLPTWYGKRIGGELGSVEKLSARKTSIHANTPTVMHLDSLGRAFLTVTHNKFRHSGKHAHDSFGEEFYHTRLLLDIEGNQREIIDALDRIVVHYEYGLLGNRIHQASIEAGKRYMLEDISGNPIRAWDSRGHQFRTTYDTLRRPSESFLSVGSEPELLVERVTYGESRSNPEANNMRGQVIEKFDQAGVVRNSGYDFKGNVLHTQRQLACEYKTTLNWSAEVPLDAETYKISTCYDAVNRPTKITTPDSSIIRPAYNEANLLESVMVNLRGTSLPTSIVTKIDYDVKGRRSQIDYGNGVCTTYKYDPLTLRLVQLLTRRGATKFPADCCQPPPTSWPGCQIQNLRYTYDPVGNITHIRDDAQQAIFFRNKRVEPDNDYFYDAIYRLIEASGREHLGQGKNPKTHSPDDLQWVNALHPGDGNAMGRYLERYIYDAVGNILSLQHRNSDPVRSGWTRQYAYNELSQLEPGKVSNRLSTTSTGTTTEVYHYDGTAGVHGNMTAMPHLPEMKWDYRDQLQSSVKQAVSSAGVPETTWYVYDAGGQRIRKLTESGGHAGQSPTRKKERLYFGGFEIFREYGNGGAIVTFERETLHIMDDQQSIALIETRTKGQDTSEYQLIRFQLKNHLSSASIELDHKARIISYEEYTPYGFTSYQSVRRHTETPKRYRFIGKERDEESGLSYHGARYYANWLSRWINCDPAGIADGLNLYKYASNNPANLVDISGQGGEEPVSALGDLILYADKVKDKAQLGSNIQKDHAISQKIIKTILGPLEKLYKPGRDLTTVVETGAATANSASKWHTVKSTLEKTIQATVTTLSKSGGPLSLADDVVAPVTQVLKQASNASQLTRAQYLAVLSQLGNMHVMNLEQTREMLAVLETGNAAKIEAAIDKLAKSRTGVAKWMKTLRDIASAENAANAAASSKAITTAASTSTAVTGLRGAIAPIVRTLAPAANFLSKIAGPIGIGLGGLQIATAKDTEGQIDGGITVVSSALLMSPHPVAKAAGGGLAAGQIIEKTLDVSEYSSSAGMFVNEGLKNMGANETASLVAGGVVTVVSTPVAIGVAGAHKTYKGVKWVSGKAASGIKSAWNYVF